ncbi:MAG: radical SAM protein [Thermoprotei archaeon]|nr:MAG: radical SAM protein [Thermoprotei archaeon]RLF20659.1 MAG: radical SAM protein [Thermoprotei archaeon]
MVRVVRIYVSEALSRSGLPDIDYALNPYVGCAHSCIYCYAREYTRDKEVAENWGKIVKVKENIVKVLGKEVRRKRRGIVGLSTITDPYQPIERDFHLSRKCLELLLKCGFPVSIQTKSDLVLKDIDVLSRYVDLVDVGITITTLEDSISSIIEPHAPSPSRRATALRELADHGIQTWLFFGPIIPGFNSDLETIRELVALAKDTNSEFYYDKLRIKRFMYEEDNEILREVLRNIRGFKWNELFEKIKEICKRHGVICKPAFPSITKNQKLDSYLS